jgi:hypothetical protein
MGKKVHLQVYNVFIFMVLSFFLTTHLQADNNQTCVTSLAITLQVNEIKIKNNRDDDGNGEFHFWRKIFGENVRLPQTGEIKRSKGDFILPSDLQYAQEPFWQVQWLENGTSERVIQFDGYEDDEWSGDDYLGQVETSINFSTFEFVATYKNFMLERGDYHVVFSLFCAPLIASSTHVDSTKIYSAANLNLSWPSLMTSQGILGYSYDLSDSPTHQPDDIPEGTHTTVSYHRLSPGTYWFRIKAQDKSGFWSDTGSFKINIQSTSAIPEISGKAGSFRLYPPFPNPFNSIIQIAYDLEETSRVAMNVINLKGERIRSLINCNQPAGQFRIQWDGKNDNGGDVATGTYFIVFMSDEEIQHHKITLIR